MYYEGIIFFNKDFSGQIQIESLIVSIYYWEVGKLLQL